MAFKISDAARKRCAEEIRREAKARSVDLRARLVALVAEHGTDSLCGSCNELKGASDA